MTRPSAVLQRIEDAAEGELLRLQYKASRLCPRRRATSRRRGPIISAPLSSRDLAWPSTASWTPAVAVPRVPYNFVPPSPPPGPSAPAAVAPPPIEKSDTKPLPSAEETAEDGLPAPPHAACEFIDVFDHDHSSDAIAPEEKHLAHQLLHKASSNLGDALFALDEVALIFSEEDHDERRGRQAAGKWRGPSTIEELRMLREAVKEVHKAFSMNSFEVVAVVRQVGLPEEEPGPEPQPQSLQPDWDSRLSSATCQTKASHYSSASECSTRGSVGSNQSASTWTSWGAPPSYGHDSQAAGWTPGWSLNSRAPSTQCDYPPPDRAASTAGPTRTHSRPMHIDSIDPLEPSIPLHLRRRPGQHHSSIAKPTLAARRLSRKPPIHPRAQHGLQHQQQRTTVVSPLRITPRIASVPAEYLSPGIHTAISEQIEVLRSPSKTAAAVDLLLTPKATEMNRGIARARARLGEEDAVASPTVPFVLGPYEGEVRRREEEKRQAVQSRKVCQSEVIRPLRPPRRRKPSTIIAGTLCNVPGVGEDDDDHEGKAHDDTAPTVKTGGRQAADPDKGVSVAPAAARQAAPVTMPKPTPHCSVAPLLSPIPGTPCDASHSEQQAAIDDDGAPHAASQSMERVPYTPTRIKPLRLCRQGTDAGRHGPGSLVAGRI